MSSAPLKSLSVGVAIGAALAGIASSQPGRSGIEAIQIRPNFYMIGGGGGNIAAQIGPDGVVLVNAGAAEASAGVLAALRRVTDQPIRYIIDTSADADYVGGNGRLAKAGRSIFAAGTDPIGGEFAKAMTNGFAASILSAENVLLRMSAPTGKTAPFPNDAWPTETFAEQRKYIYLNHEGIEVLHQPAAHSDGDSVVFFRASDVIAAGAVLDATHFPMIDVERGGSVQGEIDALNRVIELSVRPVPFVFEGGGTRIIPGHGRVYDQSDAVEYRDMVVIIRDAIQDMIRGGMTLDQIQAAAPARPWERQYGSSTGPWTTHDFVEAVYQSLTKRK